MSLEFSRRRGDGQGLGQIEDLLRSEILSIVFRRLIGCKVASLDVIHDGGSLLETQNMGRLARTNQVT